MGFSSMTRILLGLMFLSTGFIKTKRFGKEFTPDLWQKLSKEMRKMDKALRDFPGRDSVHVTAAQALEFFGYFDMICGVFLLTGFLAELAACLLLIEMLGLEYTLFIMKYPMELQAYVVGLAVALVWTFSSGGRKEKYD